MPQPGERSDLDDTEGGLCTYGHRLDATAARTQEQECLPARGSRFYLPTMYLLLALAVASAAPLDTATFAGGCFWSMERALDHVDGVVSVTVGYTGGRTPHPSYEQVSTGLTGHLESVQVVYDPRKTTYDRLVDAFWHDIDPTQPTAQSVTPGTETRRRTFIRDPPTTPL